MGREVLHSGPRYRAAPLALLGGLALLGCSPKLVKRCELSHLVWESDDLPQLSSRVAALLLRGKGRDVILGGRWQAEEIHDLRDTSPTQATVPGNLGPIVNHPGL